MDDQRFDQLTRIFATGVTRRRLLGGLLASLGGAVAVSQSAVAARCAHPGQACAADTDCCGALTCVAGTCQTPGQSGNTGPGTGIGNGGCTTGQTRCGRACVDLTADTANCGSCGTVCTTSVANAHPICTAIGCGYACNTGMTPCSDGACVPADGCCDASTCPGPIAGTCQGTPTCVDGACGFAPATAGTVCRQATGECDVDAVCDGSSTTCPANGFQTQGTACGAASCSGSTLTPRGTCDGAGNCIAGTPVDCPTCTACNAASGTCAQASDGAGCGTDQVCCNGTCCSAGDTCDSSRACTCSSAVVCAGVCCATGSICNTNGACCAPQTCEEQNFNCYDPLVSQTDGCGHFIFCGNCGTGFTCAGLAEGGTGCFPESCHGPC